VSLGSDQQSTVVLSNSDHGFTGWRQESMTFTAQNTSEVLSFLAVGTPNGVPPFSLLDGVTMDAASGVPEPGTCMLLLCGLLGGIGVRRSRRRANN